MDYIELNIEGCNDSLGEILMAELGEYPFESFTLEEGVFNAYIPREQLSACRVQVETLLDEYSVKGCFRDVETRNWNEEWERDFPRTDIEGRLVIRAPYHDPAPEGVPEVVIMPRMAFGSGTHSTTWLMAREILDLPLSGASGLDMGSGTGVLSIVAARCGAAHVDAVDIDDWADRNCRDNIRTNGVEERVTPHLGDIRKAEGHTYDFILANINRNILTSCMPVFGATLRAQGHLLMSGFLEEDVPLLEACAAQYGLHTEAVRHRDGWYMMRLKKQ